MYRRTRISQNSDPIAQRLTKVKPNEIFNDFAISWDPINEIDPEIEIDSQIEIDPGTRYNPFEISG